MTYSKPISPEVGFLIVYAKFHRREGRRIIFQAAVRDFSGDKLARAKATHWILNQQKESKSISASEI